MIRMFAFAYHLYVMNLAIIRLKIISKSRHMVICCLLLCNYEWNQAAMLDSHSFLQTQIFEWKPSAGVHLFQLLEFQ